MDNKSNEQTTGEAGEFHECDFDQNGAVDYADADILVKSMGKTKGDEGYVAACDLDGDGNVDISDWNIFLKAWNRP